MVTEMVGVIEGVSEMVGVLEGVSELVGVGVAYTRFNTRPEVLRSKEAG